MLELEHTSQEVMLNSKDPLKFVYDIGKVHPDFHGHLTFWTKFWDQVQVSRTKSFLELSTAVNLLLSNPT